ncbi:MAG: ABC-F family ATP-binding cassette domain-containing protein [Erysipelotrichales bacterium]|nr:ABC-F family ATP-binding cassette domain-containing protein [Erysipelotrichales bacterium]
MLISATGLYKRFIERDILKNASIVVEDKDKIGIVGINGMGKSTLLKVLVGAEHYDKGDIIKKNGLKVNYLPQEPTFDSETILEAVLKEIKEEQEFEAKSMLTRLGFTDYDTKIDTLSGGGRKRLALAIALLHECDLLVLDEPTNHLDSDMVVWLEKYLQKFSKAIVMVTHDRYFLERVCNKIVEVDNGNIYTYDANYEVYLEMKEKREEDAYNTYRKNKNILRRELEWIRAGVQARGTKSQSRIDNYERLKAATTYEEKAKLALDISGSRLGKKTIEAINARYVIDGKVLLNDFTYIVDRNDRLGIIGTNGVGKTTLLELLAKRKEVTSGKIEVGETVKLGYFSQMANHYKDSDRVIDVVKDISDAIETSEGVMSASTMLERFLFPKEMHYQYVNRLSGGEKRRLYLLQVLMANPNILFLDEPTNDLDITTLSILEDYLDNFKGAVICVSHDRYFLDRVVDHIFELKDGEINEYMGGYTDYEAKREVTSNKVIKNTTREKVIRFTSKEKQELETCEKLLDSIPNDIKKLDEEMNNTEDFNKIQELSNKRSELEAKLEATENRYMELLEKKEEIERNMR